MPRLGLSSFLLLLFTFAGPVHAAVVLHGRVVGVSDGDTMTIVDSSKQQHRIRLAGIDAPEMSQAYGRVSKANLSRLVYARDAAVYVTKTDRYGRLVGKIVVDGRDAGLEQLRAGLAWFYTDYRSELSASNRSSYVSAARQAAAGHLGLMADPSRMPPWQYRRNARNGHAPAPQPRDRPPAAGPIVGNRRSRIYHRPDCPDYGKISPSNRQPFASESDAIAAGYRKAGNCP